MAEPRLEASADRERIAREALERVDALTEENDRLSRENERLRNRVNRMLTAGMGRDWGDGFEDEAGYEATNGGRRPRSDVLPPTPEELAEYRREKELDRLMAGPGFPADTHGDSWSWEQPMSRVKRGNRRPLDADPGDSEARRDA